TIYSDAVDYIFSKAAAEGKPCVINASVGDYYGSHDATDLSPQLIENIITQSPGRVLVAAAGNGGQIKYHVKTNLTNSDTLFTWFTNNTSEIYHFIYADTNDIKNVKYSVGVNRPNYFDLGRIGFKSYNYGIPATQSDTIEINGNRIGIVKSTAAINSSGVYELMIHVLVDSLNYLWRFESEGSGKHDAWNFDVKSTSLPTQTVYPNMNYYVMPDTISSIVSGFQCSDEVITVGNYINMGSYYDVNNMLQVTGEVTGKLKETSSSGPTRKNIIKPDISATGANVFAAMALGMQANLITNAPQVVSQGSMHVLGGGTSAASPVVAGLAALYLQAFPNADNQQVKQAIINCAYTDGYTGTVPNNQYGYGKLDGFASMNCTIFTNLNGTGIEQVKIYPNPCEGEFVVQSDLKGRIELYDITGRLIHKQGIDGITIVKLPEAMDEGSLIIAKFINETANAVSFQKILVK
ncbi:MAG: S8 family serine peptidase, partial [Bacteroidia bacterium]